MGYVIIAILAILLLTAIPSWVWATIGNIILVGVLAVVGFIIWSIIRKKKEDEIVSAEDLYNFYASLKSPDLTELQKNELQRHIPWGKFIGEGNVVSVDYISGYCEEDKSRWERDEDGNFYNPFTHYKAEIRVVVDPIPKKFEKYYLTFHEDNKKDLLAIKKVSI